MSDFDRAFALVVGLEGGYEPPGTSDPGGETRYGISKRAYPAEDIENLTLDRAKAIYATDYWLKAGCARMPWPISALVFDAAVNQGIDPAIRCLQKALGCPQDGIFGVRTQTALTLSDDAETAALFMAERALRYTGTRNFDQYGRGWFKRLFVVTAGAAKGT